VQLAFDSADRLVELLEERAAPVAASDAARSLFALRAVSEGLARSLLDDLVSGDARLRWIGSAVGLARPERDPLLEEADYVVFDLETTGLGRGARICEIGAVRISRLEQTGSFQTLVDPNAELPAAISALTGIRQSDLRGAPSAVVAVRRFMAFVGDAVLVAHNARFDRSFLDRDLGRMTGRRLAAPVLDTLALARTLLAGRVARTGLASLSYFFGTATQPCHRALPDAEATGEILLALIGLAQERGARTVSDLYELAAPRKRKVYDKRSLAHGAPTRPGVYRFYAGQQVLYVGRARDLRARLRSYFRSERQRPSVEAALGAVDRIEWDVLGSELEAGLEELRLIRELRPPANARQSRPDRYVYLRRRGDGIVVSRTPSELGPIRSRRQAELAARALAGASQEELDDLFGLGGPLPRLRGKLRDLSDSLRYEDAARLRDRIAALERLVNHLRRLEQLRSLELCLLAPAVEPGMQRAFFLAAGRIQAVRTVPPGAGAAIELGAGVAAAQARLLELDADSVDELLLVGSFLRRPPPELEVRPLATAVARRAA
jgi:DNA polymerase III subunit epsilon